MAFLICPAFDTLGCERLVSVFSKVLYKYRASFERMSCLRAYFALRKCRTSTNQENQPNKCRFPHFQCQSKPVATGYRIDLGYSCTVDTEKTQNVLAVRLEEEEEEGRNYPPAVARAVWSGCSCACALCLLRCWLC
jgi:hypothetical protein